MPGVAPYGLFYSSQVQLKALLFCQTIDESASLSFDIIKSDPPGKLCKISGVFSWIFHVYAQEWHVVACKDKTQVYFRTKCFVFCFILSLGAKLVPQKQYSMQQGTQV